MRSVIIIKSQDAMGISTTPGRLLRNHMLLTFFSLPFLHSNYPLQYSIVNSNARYYYDISP